MYKYLLTTDGSKYSIHAAKHVMKIAANQTEVEVHIISVQQRAAWFSQSVEEVIEKTVALFEGSNIKVTTHKVEGEPAEEIIAVADSVGADHIVIGARGLGQVKGIFLGSVSQKVIHLANCPVTIVK